MSDLFSSFFQVEINDVVYNLADESSVLESANVGDCGEAAACSTQPCRNGGVCEEEGPSQYRCTCLDGFTGTYINTSRQQSIRDWNEIPEGFVERTLSVCKNHERRLTDVHSICIPMHENKKILVQDHSKIEQTTKFHNGFSNRRCHF